MLHRRFQRDLQGAIQHIQAPNSLKEAVKQLYRAHCKETLDTASIEQEVLSEYDRSASLALGLPYIPSLPFLKMVLSLTLVEIHGPVDCLHPQPRAIENLLLLHPLDVQATFGLFASAWYSQREKSCTGRQHQNHVASSLTLPFPLCCNASALQIQAKRIADLLAGTCQLPHSEAIMCRLWHLHVSVFCFRHDVRLDSATSARMNSPPCSTVFPTHGQNLLVFPPSELGS